VDRYSGILAADGGGEAILNMFSSRSSYARNKRVRVAQGVTVLEGVTAGLDASGFLRVRKDDGSEEMVLAGGVRPVD
jgi:BirA family biotin operon repressor/biotin-[acetyl-CoA-carboxylase] ligase